MKRLLILAAVASVLSATAGCGGGLFSWLNRGDACGAAAYGTCDSAPAAEPYYYGGDDLMLPPANVMPGMVEVLPPAA